MALPNLNPSGQNFPGCLPWANVFESLLKNPQPFLQLELGKNKQTKKEILFTHVYRAVCRYEGNYGHVYVYVRNPRNYEKY